MNESWLSTLEDDAAYFSAEARKYNLRGNFIIATLLSAAGTAAREEAERISFGRREMELDDR